MLLANLMSRALSPEPGATDLRLLDLLANPRRFCCRDFQPMPGNLRYFREEHTDLLVDYPNQYTRRYWYWIFRRASGSLMRGGGCPAASPPPRRAYPNNPRSLSRSF